MRATRNISIPSPTGVLRDTKRAGKAAKLALGAAKTRMSRKEFLAEEKRLTGYGANQAKGLKVEEDDIVQIIHESRTRRNSAAGRSRH
jgi:hypothetical protein